MTKTDSASCPAELERALKSSRAARAAFDRLPPSHQREHIKWVREAKKPETRARRAARVIGMLLNPRSPAVRLAAIACLAAALRAAEPAATPEDLPRIAPTEPAGALPTFKVRPGLRLELAAAEPLVNDPIAICFDENSRLFAIEMRDYSERRDERLGRVRLLEDTDGDGRFDRSSVFAEDLPWPTALCWFDGGLFVGSTPDLWYFKDTDGDGRADVRRLVFTGFGAGIERFNVQQLFNSLTWTLEARIHGASGGNSGIIRTPDHPEYAPVELRGADFSFDPRTFELRRESGGGQYGMTFDNSGRKFVCSNSAHIRQVMYEQGAVQPDMQYPLPSPALDIPADGPAAEVFRISPDEPWRVLRTRWRIAGLVAGPIEGGGRASGYFTSATGITVYRGNALGPDFEGDAFIADVGSNLVHRKKLRPSGIAFKAERAADEQTSEFLASSDLWFRPVGFANAPDGALYIIDMYREVVEHPWSIPATIKQHLDLNSGNDRGRIYRVVPENFQQPPLARLGAASEAELVPLLVHPNGWHRDTALRLLYERRATSAVPAIRALFARSGGLYPLYALRCLGALEDADLEEALRSPDSELRRHAVRLATQRSRPGPALARQLTAMANDRSAEVRAQLAWTLAALDLPGRGPALQMLARHAEDPWERHAALAAISRDPSLQAAFPQAFPRARPAAAPAAGAPAPAAPRPAILEQYAAALHLPGDAAKGLAIYLERCASCHRLFGQGTEVGPDLQSVRTAGKESILSNILDPSREVNQRFVTTEITTKDGEEWSGIIANDAPNGVTLRQANGADLFLPRTQIASVRQSARSLMPDGLEAGLTAQDLANLLAYVSGQP